VLLSLAFPKFELKDLGASGIGWLEPGAVIGEPG
jgi:hypothetical protein